MTRYRTGDHWRRILTQDFPQIPKLVPAGKRGDVRIEHYSVTMDELGLHNLRASFQPGGRYDHMEPRTYAKLIVGGEIMMSDTLMERRTNQGVVRNANGRVFIAGLGLGLILHPILKKANVSHVTVVEKSPDVVALVAPSLARWTRGAKAKLAILTADVFTWEIPKGQMYDTIYFDIWPNVCTDNLPEMARLSRKFSRRLVPGTQNPERWIGAWRADELRAIRAEERRSGW